MKTSYLAFLFFSVPILAFTEPPTKLESLTTLSGKTYNGVTIRGVDPDGIRIFHQAGAVKIQFTDLPNELKKQFNFDPSKAEEFKTATQSTQAARLMREQKGAQARAAAETEKRNTMWIVGKVYRITPEGILVEPAQAQPSYAGSDMGITTEAKEKARLSYDSLPTDLKNSISRGGSLFTSVSGGKYIAQNWIVSIDDYKKYFSLEGLYKNAHWLASLARYPFVDSKDFVFVRQHPRFAGFVDGDYVSIWVVPTANYQWEVNGGRTIKGFSVASDSILKGQP